MADITINIGPLTSTRSAPNAKAAEVFRLVVEHYGGPVNGTDQEKLDFVMDAIVRWLSNSAKERHVVAAKEAARAAAAADDKSFGG